MTGDKKPKLLMLYASAGAGHMQAAKALKAVCLENGYTGAEAIDILDYTPSYFKKFYKGSYLQIVKRIPELWGYLYDRSYKFKTPTITTRLHHAVGNMHLAPLLKYVKEFKPDGIIFTHFLGWDALGSLKSLKLFDIPFFCVVTDFAVHALWINKHVYKYYVASEGEKRLLRLHNIAENNILISGIPVSPLFAADYNKQVLREKLGIDQEAPCALMISGRYNLRGYEQLLESFKDVDDYCHIIVLAGKNKLLELKMKQIAKGLKNKKISVFGIVDNMHEFMAASDIVISKPGGLTTSEVLASKTLMAVIDPIPGQEQRNSDYLLESGVAIRIHDMETGGKKIADLLTNKRRLAIMRGHLEYVSKPRAAYDIIKDITAELALR
ncbi:MAG: glycosyltransferase [Candidatus Omnitrophica bacterium]|jgi:processive 1,2-diacylglycerol beta-glucosyltransferase|nr:glycosyltransferase [Candidatus Omnitrophota bacterium]